MRALLICLLLLTGCPRDYDHFFTDSAGGCTRHDSWSLVSRLPAPRQYGAAVLSGGKAYYLGGSGPSVDNVSAAVYELEEGAATWTQAVALPQPRTRLAAVIDGAGDVHVIGGKDASMSTQPSHWILSQGAWQDRPPTIGAHSSHSAFFANGRLYVVDLANSERLEGVVWGGIANPTTPRDNAAMVVVDGEALLIGGKVGTPGVADVDRFDPGLEQWDAARPAMLRTGRQLHSAVVAADGLVYAIGGLDPNGQPLASVETFDGSSWTPLGSALPEPRYGAAAVALPDGRILLIGGSSDGVAATDTVYAYCP